MQISLLSLLGALNYGVGVVSTAVNVALVGHAIQSSSAPGQGEAHRSIDGVTNTDYLKGSCSRTTYEFQPWWAVDLRRGYMISNVTITNQAGTLATQSPWAEIHIGESMEGFGVYNARCATITSMAAGETRSFQCGGLVGRYVTIIIPNRSDVLTLCEVQVAAIDVPERQLGLMFKAVSDVGGNALLEAQVKNFFIQQAMKIKPNINTLKKGSDKVLERDSQTCVPMKTTIQDQTTIN
ncbi:fucolectin-like [Spea bombifrons]|uniref:fucolectin-like n=1 Tax=Spea bombifrons TaxID=233779 RepID=UPI00234A7D0C|nr:fucolectin-like [Spea bombifrons]